MKNIKTKFSFFCIFISLLFFNFFYSCATSNFDKSKNEESLEKIILKNHLQEIDSIESLKNEKIIFQNDSFFSKFDFYLKNEKTVCHLIKLNLENPKLKINFFPNDNFYKEKNYSSQSISAAQFAKRTNSKIVINTTPFTQKIKLISKKNLVGIYQVDNKQFSSPNKKYAALVFFYENQNLQNVEKKLNAKIIDFQTEQNLKNFNSDKIEIAGILGGFWQILGNEKIIQFKEIFDSRTAVGIDSDKNDFYILIIEHDGKVKSKSHGLSYEQCAKIFKNLGCENAMQFDGGSSTTLFVNNKSALIYKNNLYEKILKLPAWLGFSEE